MNNHHGCVFDMLIQLVLRFQRQRVPNNNNNNQRFGSDKMVRGRGNSRFVFLKHNFKSLRMILIKYINSNNKKRVKLLRLN